MKPELLTSFATSVALARAGAPQEGPDAEALWTGGYQPQLVGVVSGATWHPDWVRALRLDELLALAEERGVRLSIITNPDEDGDCRAEWTAVERGCSCWMKRYGPTPVEAAAAAVIAVLEGGK